MRSESATVRYSVPNSIPRAFPGLLLGNENSPLKADLDATNDDMRSTKH
jgi:hypothetical protein